MRISFMYIRELNDCLNYLAPKIQRKIINLFQTLKIIKPPPLLWFLFHVFISVMKCDCLYALWPSFRGREGRMTLSLQFSSLIPLAIPRDLRCGFSLRKIWISTHLMPKWTLNPKRCLAPLPHFFCAEFCAELIKSGLINQTPLKVYVGYPCSSMKYQEVICLASTCFAKPGSCEDVWEFRSHKCSMILQLKLQG